MPQNATTRSSQSKAPLAHYTRVPLSLSLSLTISLLLADPMGARANASTTITASASFTAAGLLAAADGTGDAESNALYYWIGLAIVVGSAILSNLGVNVQKLSHVRVRAWTRIQSSAALHFSYMRSMERTFERRLCVRVCVNVAHC
jgi:hypothetical protein